MTSIDPTDYVQAEEGQSLQFQDPKQQAKFELGVCMAIYKWEELTTAVDNSWGGPKSADKRDWISGIVIDLFQEKAVDIVLIEETLLYAMVDEFDTEIDNDSALVIGDLIIKIYRECQAKNYSRVDEMYSRFQQKQASGQAAKSVVIQEDPNNPESDQDSGDESEDEPILVQDDSMDIDQKPEPKEPIIDEDGFEMVTKGRRRR